MKNQYWSVPLPEEFIAGFVGRLSWLNCKQSIFSFIQSCGKNRTFGPRSNVERELTTIGAAIGIEKSALIHHHSLIPLAQAITRSSVYTPHGENFLNFSSWKKVFKLQKRSAAFCPACSEEDLNFHGFSYWRRHHQVLGILWCEKHQGTALRHVGHHRAFEAPPDHWEPQFFDAPPPSLPSQPFPLYCRYSNICSEFLDRHAPHNLDLARSVLRHRIRHGGPNWSSRLGQPIISDLALQQSKRGWIDTVFTDWQSKRPGAAFAPLDSVRYQAENGSIHAYCLAIAVLFENPDSALAELFKPQPSIPTLLKDMDLDFCANNGKCLSHDDSYTPLQRSSQTKLASPQHLPIRGP